MSKPSSIDERISILINWANVNFELIKLYENFNQISYQTIIDKLYIEIDEKYSYACRINSYDVQLYEAWLIILNHKTIKYPNAHFQYQMILNHLTSLKHQLVFYNFYFIIFLYIAFILFFSNNQGSFQIRDYSAMNRRITPQLESRQENTNKNVKNVYSINPQDYPVSQQYPSDYSISNVHMPIDRPISQMPMDRSILQTASPMDKQMKQMEMDRPILQMPMDKPVMYQIHDTKPNNNNNNNNHNSVVEQLKNRNY